MTLVDTNVLADVMTNDPVWLDWSVKALDQRAALGALFINEVVYAELSVRMESEADLADALDSLGVELARTPTEALFLAGKTSADTEVPAESAPAFFLTLLSTLTRK